jgi:hypothetical protein
MNTLYMSRDIHHYEGPGVVFPVGVGSYIQHEVKPLGGADGYGVSGRKVYTVNTEKRKAHVLSVLTKSILKWEAVFASFGYTASTTQLAAAVKLESRSVGKTLCNLRERTSFLKQRLPLKTEHEKFGIQYNNRQGCYIWEWDVNGEIYHDD